MAHLDSYVLTNELDALNILLYTIGEAPVTSADESGLSDVAIAKHILAEESRRVQAKGFDFNTDLDYALALDINSKCPIPVNALRIDNVDGKMLVQRGGFFWDRKGNTYVLSQAVRADIVRYLPFTDLPESARYYITLKAARVFQRRLLGDDATEVFTEKDESESRADMEDAQMSSRDTNMLNGPEIGFMVRGGRNSGGTYL
jgi:hypothetical protein